jgi:methyltransferase (TIGR00027 family)
MAFYRALESLSPSAKRLFNDPFAVSFLNPSLKRAVFLSKIPLLASIISAYSDIRLPGALTSAIARTCFIDEAWSRALREGIGQIVILGSGYDCRPYRLSDAGSAVIFEVDHPGMLAMKRDKLRLTIPELPQNVRFVEIDFNREDLPRKLAEKGFDITRPALFLWEGVTNYLTHEAVDSVLRYVGTLPPGSRLVFTYVHVGVLDGSMAFSGATNLLRDVAELGEPWTFGLDPEKVPGFLLERGLHLDRDLGANEYRALYFGKRAGKMKGYEFYHVSLCHVPENGPERH